MARDKRVDEFIAKAAPFAQPILTHLRELVHREQPDVAEAIKWGMPFFTLNGRNLCGMAGFKSHCAFIVEDAGSRGGEGMGHFGKIRSFEELPSDKVLAELIGKRAEALRGGTKKVAKPRAPRPDPSMPEDLAAALAAMQGVREQFDGMSPSQRREYIDWIVDAKRPETRAKRVAQSAEWIAEGKKRNWKYEKC